MSNISFNCDVCGRQVQGCTFVNGMKFCAKCYQETFGNTTENLNSIYEGYLKILNEKDQRIAELETKLAESEKHVEFYQERYSDATTSAYGADLIAKNVQSRLEEEIRELKQQLKEKDNEHAKEMMAFEKKCQAYYNSKGFAIEQLEKVKARFNGKRPIDEMANDIGVELGYTATQIQNYIENLQEQLKDLQEKEKVCSFVDLLNEEIEDLQRELKGE